MTTTLKPYYTINASLLIKQDRSIFDPVKLNILLDNETELTPDFYTMISSLKNEYMVSLSASMIQQTTISHDLLAKLYLTIVLNTSMKRQGVIPIFSNAQYSVSPVIIDQVQNYFNQQGLCNIIFPIFNYSIIGGQIDNNYALFVNESGLVDIQNDFVKNNQKVEAIIIIVKKEGDELISLINLKAQIDDDEKNNYFNEDISQFYVKKEEYEFEITLWKERTLLYQDFLSLSKKVQEQEYYEVLNWYKNEYEILPLWYKQLGHIIKVIMGKRNFRSLLNDNVKKYKD